MKKKEEMLREAVHRYYQCNGIYGCEERAYCRFCEGKNIAYDCDEDCYADEFSEGFLAGWDAALANQWFSIKDSRPSRDEQVLCRMVSNGAIVSGYIYQDDSDGKLKVATAADFEFEDYADYECDMWMHIPPLKGKKK